MPGLFQSLEEAWRDASGITVNGHAINAIQSCLS